MTAYVREGVSFKNIIAAEPWLQADPQCEVCPRTYAPIDNAC